MLSLCLAMLSSALVSIVMRLSENKIKNKTAMLAVNYVVCAVTAALYAGPSALFPRIEGLGTALGLGLIGGAFYLGGFILLQWNVGKNGIVLSATFGKLGVLVPTLMSILFFREVPTALQILGLGLAFAAILLIHRAGSEGSRAGHSLGLIVLLLVGGMTDGMSKIYERVGNPALESHFLFYIFLSALVLSVLVVLVKQQTAGPWELFFGLLVGVPNYFCSRFLLRALSSVPAVAAFPTYSVGSIVLVSLTGLFCFGEKLGRRRWAAMGVILVSLALLNL